MITRFCECRYQNIAHSFLPLLISKKIVNFLSHEAVVLRVDFVKIEILLSVHTVITQYICVFYTTAKGNF